MARRHPEALSEAVGGGASHTGCAALVMLVVISSTVAVKSGSDLLNETS